MKNHKTAVLCFLLIFVFSHNRTIAGATVALVYEGSDTPYSDILNTHLEPTGTEFIAIKKSIQASDDCTLELIEERPEKSVHLIDIESRHAALNLCQLLPESPKKKRAEDLISIDVYNGEDAMEVLPPQSPLQLTRQIQKNTGVSVSQEQ